MTSYAIRDQWNEMEDLIKIYEQNNVKTMIRVDTFCTDESMEHYDHEEEELKREQLNFIQE